MRIKCLGYTILELVTVLACLGITTYMAVPALGRPLQKSYTEREAQKIASWFELVSLKASFKRKEFIAELSSNSLLAFESGDSKRTFSKRQIPGDLRMYSERKALSFFATGVCTPATIRLFGPERTCAIRLSLRGRTTVECPK